MRHAHADLIHAWADGAEIQILSIEETKWIDHEFPMWDSECSYRIKPKNTVRYGTPNPDSSFFYLDSVQYPGSQIKITFELYSNKVIAVELLHP